MTPEKHALNRRNFLRLTGSGTFALLASRMPVMAGPFDREDFEKLIPSDKKLDPKWVKSLYARGEPQEYRGTELDKIGMPVGGICAGQLYLGGDGRLWHWDIFNRTPMTGDAHYAHPLTPAYPFEQGFALETGGKKRFLDRRGFSDIRFRGQYPIATVAYRADDLPLEVTMEAFSPFIPLNTEDSSLPATVFHFTLKNTSQEAVEATLSGVLENAVCHGQQQAKGTRHNRFITGKGLAFLSCSAEPPVAAGSSEYPDIVFEDWNKETYDGWTVTGEAFGKGPIPLAETVHIGNIGGDTERVVNSYVSAIHIGADAATGTLTSRSFTIERNFIHAWIGGGSDLENTAFEVVVDDKVVASAAGENALAMKVRSLDVSAFKGRKAVIRIRDEATGGWGNIGVGSITFSNAPASPEGPIRLLPDFGTMGLALLGDAADVTNGDGSAPIPEKLTGELARRVTIEPGKSATVAFVLTWHFPNLRISGARSSGRSYAERFDSAEAVARHVADHFPRLSSQTRLWRDTWYDGTLPHWFLDRTFLNTSILATTTCFRFKDGRFYGWEGVGCCPGTCTSVWYYAQAVARLFPDLERSVREQQDFAEGIGFDPATGGIFTRGEYRGDFVLDGQAGNVLRVYREHQMSGDDAFLKRNWARTKKALEWLIEQDGDNDGIIDGKQSTTLDAGLWWGAMSWTSSLYLAALRAAAEMAREMGEESMAERCDAIATVGTKNLIEQLWNGEYFIHKPDRSQPTSFVIGNGCHIDQVYGQAWANQVGLGRVLPASHTRAALQAIWKYNFTPDVGPFRERFKGGRWYAMAGEGGTIMTTWPHNDRELPERIEGSMQLGVDYLNECMSGFEYQVAGHMIDEGLLEEGLATVRVIHDRYHASRRNPWNEIECGDHYSRAMASYGAFISACGYEYHGPKGRIAFAPKLTPEDFRAAFTAAEGWGSFYQRAAGGKFHAGIELRWGRLALRTLVLTPPDGMKPGNVAVTLAGNPLATTFARTDGPVEITFAEGVEITKGGKLEVVMS
jgi:non-lysosomal glucosylceramidase